MRRWNRDTLNLSNGYLSSVTDALGSTGIVHDPVTRLLTEMTDRLQRDPTDVDAKCAKFNESPRALTLRARNSLENNRRARCSNGIVTTLNLSNGYLSSVSDALGSTGIVHDPVARLLTGMTDRLNGLHTFTYDAKGELAVREPTTPAPLASAVELLCDGMLVRFEAGNEIRPTLTPSARNLTRVAEHERIASSASRTWP